MKSAIMLALAFAASIDALAADTAGYKSESKAASEIFTSTVTKVFSAHDGDVRFVAYAVTWRNQDVIVTSYGGRHDDIAVGEAIRCEMRQTHPPVGGTGKGRMFFSLLGRPGDPTAVGIFPSVGDDQARMEAVAAEVARRRGLREGAAIKMEANPSESNKATEQAPTPLTRPAGPEPRRP